MYFSKSTGGFYVSAIHGDNMPIDVTNEVDWEYSHDELLVGQSSGKVIIGDANGCPILVDPTPANAEQVWSRIKSERDRRKSLGVLADGNWFHSDADSRIQQMGLVMMGGTMPAGIQWKTMSGTFVEMTPTLAGQIFAATAALDQAIFAAAETHRAAMEASPVPADYDFSGGWPATFEE